MDTAPIFERIVTVILPVFLIVGVGLIYGRRARPDLSSFNRITLDVLCPALVFHALASKDFHWSGNGPLLLGGAVVIAVSGLLAWPIARLANVSPRTFVPSMMFNNSANMGLPLALFAFGQQGLSATVLLMVLSTLTHFTLGCRIMSHHAQWKAILTAPFIVATFLGVLCGLLDLRPHSSIMEGVKFLGEASLPMMLFALGVRLKDLTAKGWHLGVLGAVVCPVVGWAGAYLAQWYLALPSDQFARLLLFASLPPAVLNFLLAERYGQEPEKVASLVLIGNAFSILFVPLGLWLGAYV